MANKASKDLISINRRDIFKVWHNNLSKEDKCKEICLYIYENFESNVTAIDNNRFTIKLQVQKFCKKVVEKWKKCDRSYSNFLKKENNWLNKDIEIYLTPQENLNTSNTGKCDIESKSVHKEFKDLSKSSKRRKVESLVSNFNSHELSHAASISFNVSGQRNVAKAIKHITECSSEEAKNALSKMTSTPTSVIKYTPEEALSLYIDGDFSKNSYQLMRLGAVDRHADIYPSYNKLLDAKKECYPSSPIIVSDNSAEINIQSITDHTAKRLIKCLDDSLKNHSEELSGGLTFILKWGCDGSSGHAMYKQKFSEPENTDEFLFAICMVPLILKTNISNRIIWKNPKPCSTRFCRPIKIMFQQENNNLIVNEVKKIEDQISNLSILNAVVGEHEISVKYIYKLTMIDGKAFGAITDTSMQTCSICKAKPKIMNDLEKIKNLPCNVNNYTYGLSTLHAWIRCLECLLHIAYRLDIKKWQIRNAEEKMNYEARKKQVQENLKMKLNLLVDMPKPGSGTTNDGNTARQFFRNYKIASSITGIHEELIKRLGVILEVLSSSKSIDPNLYKKYSLETFKIYAENNSWYYMPSSVHRILIHGAEIIKEAILPIGMFSEEALEARNKDFRNFREFHTRKMSRKETILDLFHALLVSSDCVISTISISKRRNLKKTESVFENDMKKLLLSDSDSDDDN